MYAVTCQKWIFTYSDADIRLLVNPY